MLYNWLIKNSRSADKASVAYRCRKKRMQEFGEFYAGIVDAERKGKIPDPAGI